MNKLLITLLCVTAICPFTVSQTLSKTDDLCKSLTGWDIYTAGTYRYGPSFMYHEDGSIDGWFAASGGTYGDTYYRGSSSALRLNSVSNVAQAFTAKEDFYRVSVCCPTWNNSGQKVTISVYAFNRTYARTITTTPLYQKEVTLTDNIWVDGFYSPEAENDRSILFPAGRYMWVLSGGSEWAGVWLCTGKASGKTTQAYRNGELQDGSFQMITQDYGGHLYWDRPTYQQSKDGGMTWTKEKDALLPTQGSRDELSACDPGVIKIGNYYYLGYTSTENEGGIDNHLYMARGTSPTGPWEKWNGSGWGGKNPQPIVTYTDDHSKWGCGEPSMVVKDGTLYLYYTWDNGSLSTRVQTAPADDENWPASLSRKQTAISKSNYPASDHCDVKYIDDIGKFVAMHTSSRMTEDAYINVWISDNGTYFKRLGKLSGPTQKGLHNLGLSGDEQGHMQLSKPQFVAYAYGLGTWGQWNTQLQPLEFPEELVTYLRNVRIEDLPDDVPYYTLSGIRVAETTSGIYIKKGKKILKKQ